MNKYIEHRVLKEANYLIETKQTIREIAQYYKISKSTVHKDLQEKLPKISEELYTRVKDILNDHIALRHIKGGESTKNKYINK